MEISIEMLLFLFAASVVAGTMDTMVGVGAVMMLGQSPGVWLGVHFLYKINPQYLRAFVITICLLMLAKYIAAGG